MRRLLVMVSAVLATILFARPDAEADYRGSDPFRDLTGGEADGLMGKYPLSAYKLDTNIDSSTLPGPSWIEEAAALGANVIWWVTALFVKLTISFVSLAFDLELLDKDGAMQPISQATRRLYSTLSEPAMAFMVVLLAVWVAKKGIWDRRHGEAMGALLMSAAFMIVALIMILRPMETVGRLASMTNTAAQGVLVGVNGGSLADPDKTRTKIADELWRTHGYYPWVVLNFGGLRHCVDTDNKDEDGFPTSVAANDPKRNVCRDHVRQVEGAGGYAPRFLAQPYGSDERKAEFEAIRDGEVPQSDTTPADCPRGACGQDDDRQESQQQFAGYYVDKADSPAVDIQQKGGGYDRLGLSMAIALASLPMIILYAGIAIAIILFQLFALLLFAFTPIALLAAAIPGRGHDYFKAWGLMLIGLLLLEALFAVVIIVLMTVSTALTSATGTQGWAYAYLLLAAFYVVVLWKRHALPQAVASRRSVRSVEKTMRSTTEKVVHAGTTAVTHPMKTIRDSVKDRDSTVVDKSQTQERATKEDAQPTVVPMAGENGRESSEPPKAEPVKDRGATPANPVFVAEGVKPATREAADVESARPPGVAAVPSRQEPARQEADEPVSAPSVPGLPPQAKEPPPVERPTMPQDVEPPEPPLIERPDVRPAPAQERAPQRDSLAPPPEIRD
jgi:hypothetical protein